MRLYLFRDFPILQLLVVSVIVHHTASVLHGELEENARNLFEDGVVLPNTLEDAPSLHRGSPFAQPGDQAVAFSPIGDQLPQSEGERSLNSLEGGDTFRYQRGNFEEPGRRKRKANFFAFDGQEVSENNEEGMEGIDCETHTLGPRKLESKTTQKNTGHMEQISTFDIPNMFTKSENSAQYLNEICLEFNRLKKMDHSKNGRYSYQIACNLLERMQIIWKNKGYLSANKGAHQIGPHLAIHAESEKKLVVDLKSFIWNYVNELDLQGRRLIFQAIEFCANSGIIDIKAVEDLTNILKKHKLVQ